MTPQPARDPRFAELDALIERRDQPATPAVRLPPPKITKRTHFCNCCGVEISKCHKFERKCYACRRKQTYIDRRKVGKR